MSLGLRYFVPISFRADQDLGLALKESLLNVEGIAVDTTTNKNKWQIPPGDLDFFVQSLLGAQMRIDHAESAMAVIGKVPEAKNLGQSVWFRGEIGDAAIIQKVIRGYLTHVSVNCDADNVQCSGCGKQTRVEGLLIHLCPNSWEIVHKPRVRELSIVASPAYQNTTFRPVGFAAAMDASQGINFPCQNCQACRSENSTDNPTDDSTDEDLVGGPAKRRALRGESRTRQVLDPTGNREIGKSGNQEIAKSAQLQAKKEALGHELLEANKVCLSGEVSRLASTASVQLFDDFEKIKRLSRLLNCNKNVGSRRESQEPENKQEKTLKR